MRINRIVICYCGLVIYIVMDKWSTFPNFTPPRFVPPFWVGDNIGSTFI